MLVVIYATKCDNFEYFAPNRHDTYIYCIVENIRIMPISCEICKIIESSFVRNFLLPHMMLFLFTFHNYCKYLHTYVNFF